MCEREGGGQKEREGGGGGGGERQIYRQEGEGEKEGQSLCAEEREREDKILYCSIHLDTLYFNTLLSLSVQTLLDQTSNRKLKKDRKKDIKSMEEKVLIQLLQYSFALAIVLTHTLSLFPQLQKLEDKVEELKKTKRSSTSSAGSKFPMDSPNSSELIIRSSHFVIAHIL